MARYNSHIKNATFTLDNSNVFDASFTLDNSNVTDATFEIDNPQTPEPAKQEQTVQNILEQQGIASAEAAFLAGERKYVISSNVRYFQYVWTGMSSNSDDGVLYVEFLDSSLYEYAPVTFEMALSAYRAGSAGTWVWDNLRTRGDQWGWQVPYRLVSGNRIWNNAGLDSIARHEAIPKEGAPTKGYHPAYAYKGVKGPMGAKGGGVNLGKRGGSKKVSHFPSSKATPGMFGPSPEPQG